MRRKLHVYCGFIYHYIYLAKYSIALDAYICYSQLWEPVVLVCGLYMGLRIINTSKSN